MVKVPQGGRIAKSALERPNIIVVKTPKVVSTSKPSIKTPGDAHKLPEVRAAPKHIEGGSRKILDLNKYSSILEKHNVDRQRALSLISSLRDNLIPLSNSLMQTCSDISSALVDVEPLQELIFNELVSDLKAWVWKGKPLSDHLRGLEDEWAKVKSNLNRSKDVVRHIEKARKDIDLVELVYSLILTEEKDEAIKNFIRSDFPNIIIAKSLLVSSETKSKSLHLDCFNMSTTIQKAIVLLKVYIQAGEKEARKGIISLLSSR